MYSYKSLHILTSILFTALLSAQTEDVKSPPLPPPVPGSTTVCLFGSIVEEMPRFPGCEHKGLGKKELEECSKVKLLAYVKKNLKHPSLSESTKIEGTVYVQFTINKEGAVENIRLARNPGGGWGEAAVDVIEKMNTDNLKWTPGKQRGKVVEVQYTLPIKCIIPVRG